MLDFNFEYQITNTIYKDRCARYNKQRTTHGRAVPNICACMIQCYVQETCLIN